MSRPAIRALQDQAKARDDPGRDETEAERNDRNLVEFVQELRVGALGVQVLFGFLLSLPFFAVHFDRLSHLQRADYLISLMLAALATALFSAPVAYHRIVFRRHYKAQLLAFANLMAIAGLAAVGLAISTSIFLAVSYVEPGVIGPIVFAITVTVFACLWFVVPLVSLARNRDAGRTGMKSPPRR